MCLTLGDIHCISLYTTSPVPFPFFHSYFFLLTVCFLPFILMFKAPSPHFDILHCDTALYRGNLIIPNASCVLFIYCYLTISPPISTSLQLIIFSLTMTLRFKWTTHLACSLNVRGVVLKWASLYIYRTPVIAYKRAAVKRKHLSAFTTSCCATSQVLKRSSCDAKCKNTWSLTDRWLPSHAW